MYYEDKEDEQDGCSFCGSEAYSQMSDPVMNAKGHLCWGCRARLRDGEQLTDKNGVTWRARKVTTFDYVALGIGGKR